LPPERHRHYAQFIADYERIRAAEGRGSNGADYYLALPYTDLSGTNQSQWAIRARTFRNLRDHIFPEIQLAAGTNARVLDLGAGNGWLSYRLSLIGLRPVAVDLLVNEQDGLGAARHYQSRLQIMFPRVQAENTHLPFASGQFDAVIFNASFHYSESYASTVSEALRCLKLNGTMIVADSPWYQKESSGTQMVAERRTAFLSRFGTASDSIASQEFLTDGRLQELEQMFGFHWRRREPFYGMRWTMRPWIARIRGRREPARFQIYTARKAV
jgi:SAM-dependent methyltransferase